MMNRTMEVNALLTAQAAASACVILRAIPDFKGGSSDYSAIYSAS